MDKNLKPFVVAVCMWVAAAGLVGCESGNSSSKNTYINDRMVASQIKTDLSRAPGYEFPNVDVSCFNGIVQLNGFVATLDQKEQAGRIASHTSGVRQLVNNITIEPSLSPTGRSEHEPVWPSSTPK